MKAIHLTAYGNPAQNLKMVNVRPTVFLENPFFYGFAAESIRRTGELQLPFAAGKSSPIAAQDVARNRRGIFEGTRTDGEIPAMTWEEWADRYVKASGLPEHVSDHLAAMVLRYDENRYDRFAHDVETVTGMKPMTIGEWVRVHAGTFEGRTMK
jgi:NAD(P)H dehydrogenase (quinone)